MAAEAGAPQPARQANSRHNRQNPDHRFELLARYLDLNAAQKNALKSILFQRQHQIFNLRHAPSMGDGLQMDRYRAIEDETAHRIRAILTEEQRRRYDPLGLLESSAANQNVNVEDWLKQTKPR